MGTVLDCRGERNFKNLEKCHEIQARIYSKSVYPIRYPCYINEISIKSRQNFETEEKMVQFDSNNILETYQNSNYKSNEKYIFDDKSQKRDIIITNNKNEINNNEKNIIKDLEEKNENLLNQKKEQNNDNFENEELEINEIIEDEHLEIKNKEEKANDNKVHKDINQENKTDGTVINIKDYNLDEKSKINNNSLNTNKISINNVANIKIEDSLENEKDGSNNKKINNNDIFFEKNKNINEYNDIKNDYKEKINENKNTPLQKKGNICGSKIKKNKKESIKNENKINNTKLKRINQNKYPSSKYNNNIFQRKIVYIKNTKNKKDNNKQIISKYHNSNISENKENKSLNSYKNNKALKHNKNNENQRKKNRENELINYRLKNNINNDDILNNNHHTYKIKNKNHEQKNHLNETNKNINNFKRYSYINKINNKELNSNNCQRYSNFIRNKYIDDKLNKNNYKDKNFNLLKSNKNKKLFKTKKAEKEINTSNNTHNPKIKKNNSFQNLITSPLSDSIITNKNNNRKSLDTVKKKPFLKQNLCSKKIKNQIPVYRRLSPEDKTKNENKGRLSNLSSNKNKSIYKSPRSVSGPKNYNFRDDIWDYFNKDSFLNTSKNKAPKNIINITSHIPHSLSDNNYNSLASNNDGWNNNYNNDNNYRINHRYNKSMNLDHPSILNNAHRKNLSENNISKSLYNNLDMPKKGKNEKENIKDFIKVKIPFNGTQICPILINYSTNNIFILNYNNLNKFNDKSILYDGNIYKVINGFDGSKKLILRYFQITKNCFRYYNNIYSVLIYNERPLVQFDIRHIQEINIINCDFLNTEESKIEFVFSINLINNSDFFLFATDDKEFGISIVNVLNLLKKYYEDDRDLY